MLKQILKIKDIKILNKVELKSLEGGDATYKVICDNNETISGPNVPGCVCHGQQSGVYLYHINDNGTYQFYNILGTQVDSGMHE